MYTIAYENKDIVIRFEKETVDKKLLSNFLEFIEMEQIRNRSKLTDKQADKIAREINRKVWDKLKKNVLEEQLNTEEPIVVDTNIIISSLLHRKSPFLELLLTKKHQFYICELSIIELFNNKEKIIKLSKLKEDEVTKVFHTLLRNLNLFKENLIEKLNWQKAYQLCKDIDETDTPFVALTIELDGLLLTGDKKLKAKLKRKGFNSIYEYKTTQK